MIRLLRFLITGDWHLHEWKTVTKAQFPSRIDYVCRCEKCGAIKTFVGKTCTVWE